ncbi:hypothetical protein EPO17_00860 [Patescibacteria group bacterium]|nr:MAG: hypothetical protein EPO17_00860 [Patescibacteria group bacterium]
MFRDIIESASNSQLNTPTAMPILYVSGVTVTTSQANLEGLVKALQKVTSEALGDITARQVSVFFPQDLCLAGLGEEIIVSIQCLRQKPNRTDDVLSRVAIKVAETVKIWFREAKIVECYILTQDPRYAHTIETNTPAL